MAVKSENHSFKELKGPPKIGSASYCFRPAEHHSPTSVGGTMKSLDDQGEQWVLIILSFNTILFPHYNTVPHFFQKRIIYLVKNSQECAYYMRTQKTENGDLYYSI